MFVDLATHLWPTSLSEVEEYPQIGFAEETEVLQGLASRVMLYNDNIHTFAEVIHQVCKAVACSGDDAEGIAWEVHTRGKSMVFEGELIDCLGVSSVLEEIALHTQVMT
jgi:hypothetical protein